LPTLIIDVLGVSESLLMSIVRAADNL